jgi:glutathione S-transferase
MSFTLYDYVLSGDCYKIRLMAALLGVGYDRVAVDFFPGAAHRGPDMLALNPACTLPVLVAGDMTLTETSAMLVWLAANFDKTGRWAPMGDAAQAAQIVEWMGFGAGLTGTVGAARLCAMLQIPCDMDAALAAAEAQFRRLEARLTERCLAGSDWLVGDGPTIADIACFPYAALAPDAGIEHDARPAIRNWLYALRSLPGFLTMPGVHAMHELREGPADD